MVLLNLYMKNKKKDAQKCILSFLGIATLLLDFSFNNRKE